MFLAGYQTASYASEKSAQLEIVMQDKTHQQADTSQEQSTSNTEAAQREKRLMRSLMRELFQAERSAQSHPRVEAERHPGSPPARALEAVARHADAVMEDLPIRARYHDLPVSITGVAAGAAFSQIRRHLTDYFLDSETSYRATLLGMRHGLDVIAALREAAIAAGDAELADWCSQLEEARRPLIEECARQLSWFAQHPEEATAPVLGGALARAVELFKSQADKLTLTLSISAANKTVERARPDGSP